MRRTRFRSVVAPLILLLAIGAYGYAQTSGHSTPQEPFTIQGFGVRTALQINVDGHTRTMPAAVFQAMAPCRLVSTLEADHYPAPWGGPAFAANETGAARPDVIEACLAHEEGNRVRAAYNRALFNDERRALLAAWSEYLARERAQVVPLRVET